MDRQYQKQILELLKSEVVPAMGCTEPIAVALATAKAAELLGEDPTNIVIKVSRNILKNAMGVGIPGTGMRGIPIAAAMGAMGGISEKKLEVLADVSPENTEKAKLFVEQQKVAVEQKETSEMLYIESLCYAGDRKASAIIKKDHTAFYELKINDEVVSVLEDTSNIDHAEESKNDLNLTIKKILEFTVSIPFEEIQFLREAVEMNLAVSKEGLTHEYGLQVGKKVMENVEKGILSPGLINYAQSKACAASDARMAGCTLPVMTTTGSGNQGITAMLPVIAVADRLMKNEEKMIRALALSNLITIHIKSKLGRLSALCGAMVAGTGASAGITYLMGGNCSQIEAAIQNMAGGLTGMICDGAKLGCSLKISAAVNQAIQLALLAIDNVCIGDTDGIIDQDVEKTIANVAEIGSQGMLETDKMILEKMICK
ncbi:L-serine ammonia-lyase, iron-sulfur-dependent, subunit alpha [Halosquirtibacter laminarini]|uniref:L-serine ammonia-lyase, iron-sulfur-dependent, subunit alpha n=1 Tax=Halosquirtibacter laminarini TaxID=3374600 RepID=A0AC61NF00_9BACT|nr:L-serine ammonia-lyase, iron-sulfur-dependent, subunit alpha [Prolixibacteraceae bacterium]